jgi:hypothetical protein
LRSPRTCRSFHPSAVRRGKRRTNGESCSSARRRPVDVLHVV